MSEQEENMIKDWIFDSARRGFPVTFDDVCDSVQRILKEVKRENPFQNDRPVKSWIKGFMKQYPEVSLRTSQNLIKTRGSVTKGSILNWFAEVENYLADSGHIDVINDPERIFNCDESAFFSKSEGRQSIGQKGGQDSLSTGESQRKECLTVLVTGSAAGAVPPPTVLFKYKRIPSEIAENFPKEWGLGKTKSGWMTAEAFFEFMADIFHP